MESRLFYPFEIMAMLPKISANQGPPKKRKKDNCPSSIYLPIDSLEEHMGFDLLDAVWSVAKSVHWVTFEENPKKGLGIRTQELWHPQLRSGG